MAKTIRIECGIQMTTSSKWPMRNEWSRDRSSMMSRVCVLLFRTDYILMRHFQKRKNCLVK